MSYLESETSSKITYQFYPIPKEFFTNDFIEDPIMMKLILYIFKRIRPFPQLIKMMNNKRQVEIQLQPYEFIFGRLQACAEIGCKEKELRGRLEKLRASSSEAQNLRGENGFDIPVVKGQQFLEKRASSSTSTFTVYRLMTENLSQINHEKRASSCSQKNDADFPSEECSRDSCDIGPAVRATNKKEQEEREQENICLKETRKKNDVHNPSVTPLPPKGGVVVPLSFSIDEKIEQQFSQDDVDVVEWKLMCETIGISAPNVTTIKRWIKQAGLHRLNYSIQMLEREIAKKHKIGKVIGNKEGWIQDCLAGRWDLREIFTQRNKLFLEEFRETHKITTLKFFQKSARDMVKGYDFEFTQNPDQFQEYVNRKYGFN